MCDRIILLLRLDVKKKENYYQMSHTDHHHHLFVLIHRRIIIVMKIVVRFFLYSDKSKFLIIDKSHFLLFFFFLLNISLSFDMPHITSSSTNQSSSEFWLDVTRLSPAEGNVIAAFFSTLFRLSASSFHHDSNRNTSARLQVWVDALIIIFRSPGNPGFSFI
jgi:hypothetical protein